MSILSHAHTCMWHVDCPRREAPAVGVSPRSPPVFMLLRYWRQNISTTADNGIVLLSRVPVFISSARVYLRACTLEVKVHPPPGMMSLPDFLPLGTASLKISTACGAPSVHVKIIFPHCKDTTVHLGYFSIGTT